MSARQRIDVILLLHRVRRAMVLRGLPRLLGSAGNLTTDAHLAALALKHGASWRSADANFSRFQVQWLKSLRPQRVRGATSR